MDGILLIDKTINMTSFDTIFKARKIIGADKVGHCGTLDPFASGLIIMCINKATKINQFLEECEKEYVAILKLGEKTDTGDIDGKITEIKSYDEITSFKIKEVFATFLGEQFQIPPMHSALKKNGKKLYEYARKGIEIERNARKIIIKSLELLEFNNNLLTFKVICSKGTYIRTLGEDIAQKLDTVGHLIALRRTRIGHFDVVNAKTLQELMTGNILIIDTFEGLKHLPIIILSENEAKKARNGLPFSFESYDEKILAVDERHNPIAIYQKSEKNYRVLRGLF